jgi:hypothetical protein
MGYPLSFMREIQKPSPPVHPLDAPLTLVWALGRSLVIRSVMSKSREARVGNVA